MTGLRLSESNRQSDYRHFQLRQGLGALVGTGVLLAPGIGVVVDSVVTVGTGVSYDCPQVTPGTSIRAANVLHQNPFPYWSTMYESPATVKDENSMLALWLGEFFHHANTSSAVSIPHAMFSPLPDHVYPWLTMFCDHVVPSDIV